MGGHSTKISVKDTNDIVTNVLLDSNQNCVSYAGTKQKISVSGTGNIVNGVTQEIDMSVDKECVANVTQNAGTQQKIANQIAQSAAEETVAMTQWLGAGKTTVTSNIDNKIKTDITEKSIQDCMSSLDAKQVLLVAGEYNVVSGVLQEAKLGYVGGCIQSSDEIANATSDTSNTINQHSSYEAQNPLAFIGDAIEAIGIAVVIFIFLIVLIFVYEILKGRSKRKAAEAQEARQQEIELARAKGAQ